MRADAATVCNIFNGCTGTSSAPAYGQLLIGGKNGEYEYVASSTLGGGGAGTVTSVFGRTGVVTAQTGDYTTSQVPEGSNLYYTLSRWAAALAGTTTDAAGRLDQPLLHQCARRRARGRRDRCDHIGKVHHGPSEPFPAIRAADRCARPHKAGV